MLNPAIKNTSIKTPEHDRADNRRHVPFDVHVGHRFPQSAPLGGVLQPGPFTQHRHGAGHKLGDKITDDEHDNRRQQIRRVRNDSVPGIAETRFQRCSRIRYRIRQIHVNVVGTVGVAPSANIANILLAPFSQLRLRLWPVHWPRKKKLTRAKPRSLRNSRISQSPYLRSICKAFGRLIPRQNRGLYELIASR